MKRAHRRHQADRRAGAARRARARRAARRRCGPSSCRALARGRGSARRARGSRRPARRTASSSSGARSAIAARWRGDRRLVAARDGRSARARARAPPSSRRSRGPAATSSSRSTPAVGGQPLGGGLERDEEVRGDRGGRVVGGAVVVGDSTARIPSAPREPRGDVERARACCPAIAAPAPANARARRAVTVISGCSENASCGASGVEPGGARAVADERPGRDRGGGGGDLAVGDAQQHDVGARAVAPRPSGPSTSTPGRRAAPRAERVPEPAPADDRARRRAGQGCQWASPVPVPASEIPVGVCDVLLHARSAPER